jgi:hypothetical protein
MQGVLFYDQKFNSTSVCFGGRIAFVRAKYRRDGQPLVPTISVGAAPSA